MKTIRRITKKDLNELARTHPGIVEHYRNVKRLRAWHYRLSESDARFERGIYQETREDILDLIEAMKAGQLARSSTMKGGD